MQWLTSHLGATALTVLSVAWGAYILVLGGWIVMQRREPVATLAWLLSLSLLPIIGFGVYYFFGPQRLNKQRLKRMRSRAEAYTSDERRQLEERAADMPPQIAQLARLGRAACGLPVSTAHEVKFISGGSATFDAICADIAAVRDHVHLEYYIFEPDATGTRVRDLLVRKAREGVMVRVLADALGSKRLTRRFMAPLIEAGGQFAFFHDTRIGRRLRPVTNYRTHRKIVVCDGRVGYTGGVNITDEEDERRHADAYHDAHLRIEGPAVRWLQTTFVEDWTYAAGPITTPFARLVPPMTTGAVPVQIVTSGPDTLAETIHRMHVEAIQDATERVWLTTPYFVPGPAALMALTNAALRGVDVRLMVPRRSDSLIVSACARSYYDELMTAGVKIWEYKARMLHSKTLVVDDQCAMIGTANFDLRSFRLNFEVMAVVYGPTLALELSRQFEADLRQCAQVSPRKKPRFPQRLGDSVARVCSPLL
jgi:cardiolipin synthase